MGPETRILAFPTQKDVFWDFANKWIEIIEESARCCDCARSLRGPLGVLDGKGCIYVVNSL